MKWILFIYLFIYLLNNANNSNSRQWCKVQKISNALVNDFNCVDIINFIISKRMYVVFISIDLIIE